MGGGGRWVQRFAYPCEGFELLCTSEVYLRVRSFDYSTVDSDFLMEELLNSIAISGLPRHDREILSWFIKDAIEPERVCQYIHGQCEDGELLNLKGIVSLWKQLVIKGGWVFWVLVTESYGYLILIISSAPTQAIFQPGQIGFVRKRRP